MRPEKFHVQWQRAWTWYPFRVHAEGVSGHGQSRRQQWQFSAERASASVSLLPLVFKRVWLRGVEAENVSYRQRPRLRPDRDYSRQLPNFPPIEGREVTAVDPTPLKSKRPWHVSIRDFAVSGTHQLWIYQARGELSGSAAGALAVESRGGEFSLDVQRAELALQKVRLSDAYPVFERGELRGTLGFAPFLLRDNRGARMLAHLRADLELDVEPVTLAFINLFTLNMSGLTVGGEGAVRGRVRYRQGQVLSGTDLQVRAPQLRVSVAEHDIVGNGDVALRLGPQTGEELDLAFHFDQVSLSHRQAAAPLLLGEDLLLKVGGDGRVLPHPDRPNRSRSLGLELQDLEVPDLALLQRYLPPKWPLRLTGGDGRLSGRAVLAPTALDVQLQLSSDAAAAAVNDYAFQTNIDAALVLNNPALAQQRTGVGGSYIRLGGAQVQREGLAPAAPWQAHLEVLEGEFGLLAAERKGEDDVAVDLLQLLARAEAKQLLGESRGRFAFQAGITDLAWLGLFLGDTHNTRITGEGTLAGELFLESGLPAPGTDIEVLSDALGFGFLDYLATGDGRVALRVEEGGAAPDWLVAVELDDGELRRDGDEVATVTGADLAAKALAKDVTLGSRDRDLVLQLLIDEAQVTDMAVFNSYLPAQAPLRFTGGSADLAADIRLWPEDAQGWLRLEARRVQAALDQQQLQGDLLADVQLAGGVPSDMRFDITGSSLRLDEVTVQGDNEQFDSHSWSAVLQLQNGQTRWRAPLQLDAELALTVSDSRPLVAVFDNGGWRPEFMKEMLTVEDISGEATLQMADDTLLIPQADITSDHIEAGARGVFGAQRRQGVFYLRYKKADALLKIDGDSRNLDVLKAREKYLDYDAGGPLP